MASSNWLVTRVWLEARHPIERVGLAIAWLISIAWLIASAYLPFGWDHGMIASVGDTVVRGGLPYRDAWDMKGPMAPFAFALAQTMFGRTMWGIRAIEAPLMLGSAFVLVRLVTRLGCARAGAWAGAAYLLWYSSHGWFFTAQPDGWVAAATLIAFAQLVDRTGPASTPRLLSAAVLIGICGLVKPLYLALLAVPLALAILDPVRRGRSMLVLALVCATALPVSLVLGWFAVRDGLADLVQVHIVYAGTMYRTQREAMLPGGLIKLAEYFAGLLRGFPWYQTPVLILPLVGVGAWRLRKYPRATLTLALWTAVTIAGIVAQNRFYPYHMFPLFPPMLIIAGMGMYAQSGPRYIGWVLAAAPASVFLIAIATSPARDVLRVVQLIGGWTDLDRYHAEFEWHEYNVRDQLQAAAHIRSTTRPEDQVYVFGNDATTAYLSGRTTMSRFVFNLPVTIEGPYLKGYRAELMRDLAATPPEIFVVGLQRDESKQAALDSFPELAQLLNERYDMERQIGILNVYRLRGSR